MHNDGTGGIAALEQCVFRPGAGIVANSAAPDVLLGHVVARGNSRYASSSIGLGHGGQSRGKLVIACNERTQRRQREWRNLVDSDGRRAAETRGDWSVRQCAEARGIRSTQCGEIETCGGHSRGAARRRRCHASHRRRCGCRSCRRRRGVGKTYFASRDCSRCSRRVNKSAASIIFWS